MNLLQTIWAALTTENETLTLILCAPLTFLEAYISALLFTTLLDINTNKKKIIYYVIVFSLIAIIDIFIVPAPFNAFVNILTCPLLCYFIFNTNILKAVLSEIVPYVFFVLIGSLIVNTFSIITKIPTWEMQITPIYKILFSLLIYIFTYLLYIFLKKFKITLSINDFKNRKNNKILFLNLLVGIIAIFVQSYLATFYNDFLPFYITLTSVFVLLVYFLISMYSLSRTSKLEVTAEKLQEEQLYNKTITILYDNIRGFRHNFNNTVQAIGGYISTNDMDGLKTYYKDLLNDSQNVNNLTILNPELINNPAVYSTITSKYYEAESYGIKMNLEILLDLKNLNIKTYDLTIILGILLDNAIEASSKCDEKEINVIIRKDAKLNRQLFIIENTYTNKDVDTNRIFEKGYTSKKNEDKECHGLGLWNVRQILKKNNNLNLFTSKTEKIFKQQLEIYF